MKRILAGDKVNILGSMEMMMRYQDLPTLQEYVLMGQLRQGPVRHFDEEAAASLVEKGYAAIEDDTGRLAITDEGRKVRRILRRAG